MSEVMPKPDPALKRLEVFVGSWVIKGRTLDSKVDNVSARTTFEKEFFSDKETSERAMDSSSKSESRW